MRTTHEELIRLMRMRMEYVSIIAALKFILKKPIYVPSVEEEQCHHLMAVASQFGLNASLVRSFMRVLFKISREIQRKMHMGWSLEEETCMQFLLSRINHIPMLQGGILNDHALFFSPQFLQLFRFFIRFIDLQMMSVFSSLTTRFSLGFIKKQVCHWTQLPSGALLYKLFLLMNGFVKKEEVCC